MISIIHSNFSWLQSFEIIWSAMLKIVSLNNVISHPNRTQASCFCCHNINSVTIFNRQIKLLSANKVKFNLLDKITKDGKVQVQQGIIAGCAGGTYDNIIEASNIIDGKYIGKNEFTMSVYPSSQPIYYDFNIHSTCQNTTIHCSCSNTSCIHKCN